MVSFCVKMNVKLLQKRGESFNSALIAILLSIAIFSIAFIGEDSGITGLVIDTEPNYIASQSALIQYNDVDSLGSLAAGDYFIDNGGVVYWLIDDAKIAVAVIEYVDEVHQNRHIYIDDEGNIGYVLS